MLPVLTVLCRVWRAFCKGNGIAELRPWLDRVPLQSECKIWLKTTEGPQHNLIINLHISPNPNLKYIIVYQKLIWGDARSLNPLLKATSDVCSVLATLMLLHIT